MKRDPEEEKRPRSLEQRAFGGLPLFGEDHVLHARVDRLEAKLRKDPRTKRRRKQAVPPGRKVKDPVVYPVLTAAETAEVLRIHRSTIYRWLAEGKLSRASAGQKPGKRARCLVLTRSVKKLLRKSSE